MSVNPHPFASAFHIDVTTDSPAEDRLEHDPQEIMITLLRHLVMGQERQSKLLEELIQQVNAVQRQRATELGQWKAAHPNLARRCKAAAETLGRVQNEFLLHLTEEVADNEECLADGEFMLNEFVDRYGPRLAHLNGVVQALSQLSCTPDAANSPR